MNKTVTIKDAPSTIEKVLVTGDLSALTSEQRVVYHDKVCQSLGLNPLTRHFQYIKLNSKLLIYASKDCTEQLRKKHDVSLLITDRRNHGDVYVVTAKATLPSDRTDESTGAVSIGGLKGDALANAYMKAETKAKRRVTLSVCGLGLLDETEVQDIPNEIRDVKQPPKPAPKKLALPSTELTKKDMNQLTSLIEESGFEKKDIVELCETRWKVKSAAKLTKVQFTELCEILAGGGLPVSNDETEKVEIEDAEITASQPPPPENHVSQ